MSLILLQFAESILRFLFSGKINMLLLCVLLLLVELFIVVDCDLSLGLLVSRGLNMLDVTDSN